MAGERGWRGGCDSAPRRGAADGRGEREKKNSSKAQSFESGSGRDKGHGEQRVFPTPVNDTSLFTKQA